MRSVPGVDLDVIPVGDEREVPIPPRRRGTAIAVAALVAGLAGLAGFLVGRAERQPSPVPPPVQHGVLWACHGTVAGSVRFTGLPRDAFVPYGDPKDATYPPPRFGPPLVGGASLADRAYVPSPSGEIVIPVVAVDGRGGDRVLLALRRNDGASAEVRLRVPVVRC